jgi:predicted amidophosphoribosyltransferase
MKTYAPVETGGPCPYCTQPLPEGRGVVFCPQCGMNVTVPQCPACSSEVEAGWKFCVTCGRDVARLAVPQRAR